MNKYTIIDHQNQNFNFDYIKKIDNLDLYIYKYETSEIFVIVFFDKIWKIKYYSELDSKILTVDLVDQNDLNSKFINLNFNKYELLDKNNLYFLSILDNYNQLSSVYDNNICYLFEVNSINHNLFIRPDDIFNKKEILARSNDNTKNFINKFLEQENNNNSYICVIKNGNKYDNIVKIINNELINLLFFDKEYNIYFKYIELYNNNLFKRYGKHICKYCDKTYDIINNSIISVSREILNIYHFTRNKKNPSLYNKLLKKYKKILYDLHNIYISMKNNDSDENIKKISIGIINIINYLKTLSAIDYKNLLVEREIIIKSFSDNLEYIKNIFDINNNDILLLTELLNK